MQFWTQTGIQLAILACAVIAVVRWVQVSRWQQGEAAARLHHEMSTDPDCRLARSMIEYQDPEKAFTFSYDDGSMGPPVTVRYEARKREAALTKKYRNLSAEEQAVRHIFDVYIDRLELVMLHFDNRTFHRDDLFYFKHWLDALVGHECEDVIRYAEKSRSARFAPFLSRYAKRYKPYLERRMATF